MDYFEEPQKKKDVQSELFTEKSPAELAAEAANLKILEYNQQSIENFKHVLNDLIQKVEDPNHETHIDIDAQFDLKIRVKGDQWRGYVDETVAHVILKYQEELDNIQKKSSDGTITEQNRIRIRAKIEEGSSVFDLLFDENIKEILTSMDPENIKIILICAILTVGGTPLGLKALSIIREIKLKKIESEERTKEGEARKETRMQELKSFEKMGQLIADAKAAPKYIVKQMDSADRIQFPVDEAPIRKEEASTRYVTRRKPTVKVSRENIFDDFLVADINIENPKEPMLKLKCKGVELVASLEIVGAESEGIADSVKTALQEGERLILPLNVHVFHKAGFPEKSKILSMGEAMDGAQSLEEVLRVGE